MTGCAHKVQIFLHTLKVELFLVILSWYLFSELCAVCSVCEGVCQSHIVCKRITHGCYDHSLIPYFFFYHTCMMRVSGFKM